MGLAPLTPALLAVIARLATGPHPIDDAYITFRYARNLATGLGLVYNPGESVLGTTAPLWALLLAAGHALGSTDLPWLATALSSLCDAASTVLLVVCARRLGVGPAAALLVGLAWALNPTSVAFATGGMETSLFVVLTLTVLMLASRSAVAAALLAGVAAFVRPEGALLAVSVVAYAALARKRVPWREALAAGVPMLLGATALLAAFGSPLPHSVAAKQVAYAPISPFENPLALLLQAGLPGWSTFLLSAWPAALCAAFALLGLAALIGSASAATTAAGWQRFALFGALFVTFYVVAGLRGVRLFSWYLVPLAPLYLLTLAAGISRFRAGLQTVLATLLVAWQLAAVDWQQPLLPAGASLEREQLFLEAGSELRDTLSTSATVAAPEIGALGYVTGLRILDTVGLVSPVALAYYPLAADQLVTDNAIPAALIDAERPDAIVSLDAYVQGTLLQDPTFLRDYRLVKRVPADVWQSHALLVFRRVAEP